MVKKLLDKVMQEFYTRAQTIHSEINSLQIYTKNKLSDQESNFKSFEETIITKLETDKEIHKLVMTDKNATNDASIAFKTNKLAETLDCATNVLNTYGLYQLLNKPLMSKLEEKNQNGFSFETTNKNITSYLNCVQTVFLTSLSVVEHKNNFQDLELAQKLNAYNVETSPLVQTTKFPANYTPTNYTLANGNKVDITSWFYYFKDHKSPTQGELLLPNLGYQFGGSREESRYKTKELKSEDCSSAASKWLGFKQSISTVDYELIYLGNHSNTDLNNNNLIKPITDLNKLSSGNIYVTRTYDIAKNPEKNDLKYAKGGHIGIITKITSSSNNVEEIKAEVVSYTRNMPVIEGFIAENITFNNKAMKYYFFEFIGEDNNLYQDEL